MARLMHTGFEVAADLSALVIDGNPVGTNHPTKDTSVFRSGAASIKCDTGAGAASSYHSFVAGGTTSYARAYFNFVALPTNTSTIMAYTTTPGIEAKITSAGKLQLFISAVQQGSDSDETIVPGQWYRIELFGTPIVAGATSAELRLNGSTVAAWSGSALIGSSSTVTVGWIASDVGFGASKVLHIDDVAQNDDTGAANNSWCGDGKVILMLPVSDNARGAWTGGAGGTTNLFDAVNNIPPVGVADASATNTSQIKNKTATNPAPCDLNLATYLAAGIGPADIINAIYIVDYDGEDPATGTKTGATSMVSNPAIAEPAAYFFGDDLGAQSTWPGLWRAHAGVVSNLPSVVLSTAPVIRIRCIAGSTTARATSCCLLGAYVDYSPMTHPVPLIQPPAAVQRAANW